MRQQDWVQSPHGAFSSSVTHECSSPSSPTPARLLDPRSGFGVWFGFRLLDLQMGLPLGPAVLWIWGLL